MRDSVTHDVNPLWVKQNSTTDDINPFWIRQDSITGKGGNYYIYIVPQTTNSEDRGWLKLSESAFKFWDNLFDEKWNEVR